MYKVQTLGIDVYYQLRRVAFLYTSGAMGVLPQLTSVQDIGTISLGTHVLGTQNTGFSWPDVDLSLQALSLNSYVPVLDPFIYANGTVPVARLPTTRRRTGSVQTSTLSAILGGPASARPLQIGHLSSVLSRFALRTAINAFSKPQFGQRQRHGAPPRRRTHQYHTYQSVSQRLRPTELSTSTCRLPSTMANQGSRLIPDHLAQISGLGDLLRPKPGRGQSPRSAWYCTYLTRPHTSGQKRGGPCARASSCSRLVGCRN